MKFESKASRFEKKYFLWKNLLWKNREEGKNVRVKVNHQVKLELELILQT